MAKHKREVTDAMINMWGMTTTDWMGYEKGKRDIFTFHHLKVAKRFGGPIEIWNGAILCGQTAHPYLHTVEIHDRDRFLYLTKILIEVNEQRHMPTREQLLKIDEALNIFEQEHSSDTNKDGYYIIKDTYTRRLVKKRELYFFDDSL